MLKISGPIPIIIHPFFWLLAIAIGWLNTSTIEGTVIWALLILASVLVHEFGHALTAVAFGQKAHIELVGFGGVTQRSGPKKPKLWQEFVIVLNGPLAGFMLCGLAFWAQRLMNVSHPHSSVTYAVNVTYYINLFWTVLNLLPIQPLDGGKLLSIVLEGIFGLRGTKIALFISLVLGAAIGLFFFAIQAFLAGSLFLLFTYESYRTWKSSLALTDHDKDDTLQQLFKAAEQEFRDGHKDAALTHFKQICASTKAGVLHLEAIEYMARILAEKLDYQAAYALLSPQRAHLSPPALRLLHQLAYRLGKLQEAVSLGDKVYQDFPKYDVALLNALSHALLGQVRPAIGWLQCAIREGLPNPLQACEQPEFDPIRQDPLFQQLKGTLA